MTKKSKKTTVEFHFDNEKAAEEFLGWLCNVGEQDYWLSMEYAEKRDKTENLTAIDFDYHILNKGKFGPKVKATCGRLDDEDAD